jgi:hypothetical protein
LLGLVAWAALGISTAQAAEIAVLDLELDPSLGEESALQKLFFDVSSSSFSQAPITGENIEDLVQLFGCAKADSACLTKVSSSLKVRYVFFGRLDKGYNLEVSLFDAASKTTIATSKEKLAKGKESEGIQKATQRALSLPGAVSIRNPALFPKEKEARANKEEGGNAWRFAIPGAFAAGAIATGIPTLVVRFSKNDDDPDCENAQDQVCINPTELGRIKITAPLTDAFTALAIGTGVWAILSSRKHASAEEKTARVQPLLSPRAAGFSVSF